jgi:lipoate-protein ligase A
VKKTRQRYYKSFEAMLDKLRNPVAKPTAKSKAKGKAKTKVDLTNKGKGITAEQVIALMINGCAKLNKDKAEQYLDKLAEQLESLRNNVMSGKPVLECEA